MMTVVALGLIGIVGGVSLLHSVKTNKHRRASYTAQMMVILVIGYLFGSGVLRQVYIADTDHVNTHAESVELKDLTKKPVEHADFNIRVRLGAQEPDGNTYYVVNDPIKGIVKVPVEVTKIVPKPAGALMRVHYTQVKSNWFTQFFSVADHIQSDKFTLYIAPGSVDLSTKPDTTMYPTYLKYSK